MNSPQPRFSLVTQGYVWTFLVALSAVPVMVLAVLRHQRSLDINDWIAAAAAMACIQVLFWYVQKRCTSEAMPYWRGLHFVASFMSAGWFYISVLVVYPSLLLVFLASLGFALYGDVASPPVTARERYHRMILFFHRNRMYQ